jgi:glucose dehydrogenase
MNHPPVASGVFSSISIVGAISAWQVQLEFWLRCGAAGVAIVAGLVSIYVALRRRQPRPPQD